MTAVLSEAQQNMAGSSVSLSNDEYIQKLKLKVQNTRIALSKQGARFELPIDMKSLEGQTPQEYLVQRCHVMKRRENLYKKHFYAHDKDKDQKLNMKEVEKAIKDIFVDTIDFQTIETVRLLATIQPDELVSFPLFSTLCALSERIMHQKYSTGEASLDPDYSQKDMLEEADFSSLTWKLDGIVLPEALNTLLFVILDPNVNIPARILDAVEESGKNVERKSEYDISQMTGSQAPPTSQSNPPASRN